MADCVGTVANGDYFYKNDGTIVWLLNTPMRDIPIINDNDEQELVKKVAFVTIDGGFPFISTEFLYHFDWGEKNIEYIRMAKIYSVMLSENNVLDEDTMIGFIDDSIESENEADKIKLFVIDNIITFDMTLSKMIKNGEVNIKFENEDAEKQFNSGDIFVVYHDLDQVNIPRVINLKDLENKKMKNFGIDVGSHCKRFIFKKDGFQ